MDAHLAAQARAPRPTVGGLLLAVLLLSVSTAIGPARAQSPVTEVEASDGTTLMTLFDNGVLEVPLSTGGYLLPDGTLLDESSDLTSLRLPFSGTASTSDPLLELIQNGEGAAGFFDVANSSSSTDALTATTTGTGRAGEFKIFNSSSTASAVFGQTGGSGSAVQGLQTGTSGRAGEFTVENTDNFNEALLGSTNGSGNAIKGLNEGTGRAGLFQILNEQSDADALAATTNGTGLAGDLSITNTNNFSPVLRAETVGGGRAGLFRIANAGSGAEAFRAETNGGSHAGVFEIENTDNDSSAVQGVTEGRGPAVQGIQRGTGRAGDFQIYTSSSPAAALRAETIGTGPAITGIQRGTTFDSSAHAGFFEVFNTNSDAEALLVETNGSGEAVDAIQNGTGRRAFAGHFRIVNSDNDAAALLARTFGGGFAARMSASKNAVVRDNPDGNVVLMSNGSFENGPDVLGLKAGPSNPGAGVNYVSFYDRNGNSVGAIEGNGSGGVEFKTSGADYAEALPVVDGSQSPEPADLVGVHSGRVGLETKGADRLMVVTGQAAVLGNALSSADIDSDSRVPVAFIGQVPVKVRGSAAPGDWIVASGREDGTARTVSPGEYRPAAHGAIVGQAWSRKTTPDVGNVTVAVGLGHSVALTERFRKQQDKIDELRDRVRALEDVKERQAQIATKVSALMSQQSGRPWVGGSHSFLLAILLGVGGFGAGVWWRRWR